MIEFICVVCDMLKTLKYFGSDVASQYACFDFGAQSEVRAMSPNAAGSEDDTGVFAKQITTGESKRGSFTYLYTYYSFVHSYIYDSFVYLKKIL